MIEDEHSGELDERAGGLLDRYHEAGDPEDLTAARRLYAAPADRAEAFLFGLAALHRVFRRQADRPDKESWLWLATELPAEAGRACARAGSPAGAVMAMDAGRGLLLRDVLA